MTELDRLQTTTLEDEFFRILNRLVDFSSMPEGEIPLTVSEDDTLSMYKRVKLHSSLTKPTLTKMKAELEIWRTAAVAQEEARLAEAARKQDLSDRFESLSDMRSCFHNQHPDTPNPALWCKELLENEDHTGAEQLMKDLESKDSELKAEKDSTRYIRDRQQEYRKIDDLLKEAIVEKEQGDSTKWDAYLALRSQIKLDIPKPA